MQLQTNNCQGEGELCECPDPQVFLCPSILTYGHTEKHPVPMLRPLYLRLGVTLELGIPGFSFTSNKPI